MDKLAAQLKQDAAAIAVEISPEMERRLAASIEGAQPERPPSAPVRPAAFWWASSLTGVTAALLLVVLLNQEPGNSARRIGGGGVSPVAALPDTPQIDWHTESAMLIGPLQQELDALQSDIKKAEQTVKREIGL